MNVVNYEKNALQIIFDFQMLTQAVWIILIHKIQI